MPGGGAIRGSMIPRTLPRKGEGERGAAGAHGRGDKARPTHLTVCRPVVLGEPPLKPQLGKIDQRLATPLDRRGVLLLLPPAHARLRLRLGVRHTSPFVPICGSRGSWGRPSPPRDTEMQAPTTQGPVQIPARSALLGGDLAGPIGKERPPEIPGPRSAGGAPGGEDKGGPFFGHPTRTRKALERRSPPPAGIPGPNHTVSVYVPGQK